jgi:hypothetical protein
MPCYNLADGTAQKRVRVNHAAKSLSLLATGIAITGGLSGCYRISRLGTPSGQGAPVTAVVTASPAPVTPAYQECGWQWATQDLPDVTRRLSAGLDGAGIAYTRVDAYAFGENCLNAQGEVQYFATKETDFDLTLTVSRLADRESVGNLMADALAILVRDFAPDATPGPQPGQITLIVSDGSREARRTIQQGQVADVVARGLRGGALLDELGF